MGSTEVAERVLDARADIECVLYYDDERNTILALERKHLSDGHQDCSRCKQNAAAKREGAKCQGFRAQIIKLS